MRHSGVRYVSISADQAGQRLDNYLLCLLRGVPRSLVYRIIRQGQVRVNQQRSKPVRRLQQGDQLRIPPVSQTPRQSTSAPAALLQQLSERILYEDEDYLVINKPTGLAVHGGTQVSQCLRHALRALHARYARLELAHRLDKATSGCLVLAKRRTGLRHFQQLLQAQHVEKHYLALVHGIWHAHEQAVCLPLSKRHSLHGGHRVVVDVNGQVAETLFTTRTVFDQHSLMAVTLKTGRTHQIRVHAAAQQHPVVGDTKYGAYNVDTTQSCPQLGLHATRIVFTNTTGILIDVQAPLEPALAHFMEELKQCTTLC